jgi:hypothetical protein
MFISLVSYRTSFLFLLIFIALIKTSNPVKIKKLSSPKATKSLFDYFFRQIHPERCHVGYDKEAEGLFLENESLCSKKGILLVDVSSH